MIHSVLSSLTERMLGLRFPLVSNLDQREVCLDWASSSMAVSQTPGLSKKRKASLSLVVETEAVWKRVTCQLHQAELHYPEFLSLGVPCEGGS